MLWAIKARLWPRIELVSSRGEESWYRESTKILHLGGSSGILQDKVRMLGAVALCSLSEHIFCCALLTLRCATVNKWHSLLEARGEPCSAVPQWSHMAYGTNLSGLIPTCQCQEAPNASIGNWPEMGKVCGLNSPFSVKFLVSLAIS